MSTQGNSLQDEVEDERRSKWKKENNNYKDNKKETVDQQEENKETNTEEVNENKTNKVEEDLTDKKEQEEDEEVITDKEVNTSEEGNEEDLPKKEKEFRVIVQNVRTMDPRHNFYKLYTHRKELENMEGDAYLFSETNTNAWFPKIKKVIKNY